jgi:HAD superfamily hydrolase (TIGR01509 family)
MREKIRYKLVIFDCDGVLADSEPISNRLFTDMVNELGLKLSYKISEKLFTGRSDDDCIRIVKNMLDRSVPSGFIDDFNCRLMALLDAELTAVKNVDKVLKFLSGIPVCVGSNAPREKVKRSLNKINLDCFFMDNVFTVQDVTQGKPFPELYLYAAEKMGVLPEECAVIEDSISGVRAGIAAGMTVFGYTERSDELLLKKEGAVIFDNMLDLPDLLKAFKG